MQGAVLLRLDAGQSAALNEPLDRLERSGEGRKQTVWGVGHRRHGSIPKCQIMPTRSLTIDGEMVICAPDGRSDFDRVNQPRRVSPFGGHEVVIANREKTGRIVGTVAAVGIVISVLAIIFTWLRGLGCHLKMKAACIFFRRRLPKPTNRATVLLMVGADAATPPPTDVGRLVRFRLRPASDRREQESFAIPDSPGREFALPAAHIVPLWFDIFSLLLSLAH